MRVTLSDIAKKTGVTPSTVQRALNGMPGVSEEKREEICRVAQEMGYRRNYIASSLKKGAPKIALVLPEQGGVNRYYAKYLWEGADDFLEGFTEFNFTVFKYTYERGPGQLGKALAAMFAERAHDLDGVLTMGTAEPEVLEVLEKIKKRKIPVVLVGTDSEAKYRMCCVKTNNDMAGRMAADLLINFFPLNQRSHAILTGDFSIPDQYGNAQGFEKQLLENKYPLEVLKLGNLDDLDAVKENIKYVLGSGLNICALYSCSARNTVAACQAVQELGCHSRVCLIGSDIFPESIEYVKQGVLRAIIHKRPARQAYTAMQILTDCLLRGTSPKKDIVLVDSVIVMKSNLESHM